MGIFSEKGPPSPTEKALVRALEEAVTLFEGDDESNSPGTDAYLWVQSARTLIQKHRSQG